MVLTSLLIAAVAVVIAAGAYLFVAQRLRRHLRAGPEARRALPLFMVWWVALGLNSLIVGVSYLLGAYGVLTLELQLVNEVLQRLLLSVGMVGLMGYLTYLLTGRRPLGLLIGVYTTFLMVNLTLFTLSEPAGVVAGPWRTYVEYAHPETQRWSSLLSLATIILPPVVGALLYLRLVRVVSDRSQRYRIIVVSATLLAWWTFAVVAGSPPFLDDDAVQLGHRLTSVAAALAVAAAFEPPAWMQRRLRVQPFSARA